MLLNGGTCADQAREWTDDTWVSQSWVATRGDRSCACASVQHDHLATSLSARTSFDAVTRWPDVRGPLHVLSCEPGVQDRLFLVQVVASVSPLASLAPFLA